MILITGGAGYVGSELVFQLQAMAEPLVVLDNLTTGVPASIPHAELITGDVGDEAILKDIFTRYPIAAVMHLAAKTVVQESVEFPERFYLNNTAHTTQLIQQCIQHNVQHFIFSSTAAVYGTPSTDQPIEEAAACHPINPYGKSKLFSEQILQDSAKAAGMNYMILRYFNVAGADPGGQIGPYNPQTTLLIRYALQVALGMHRVLKIFGNDYTTVDGTGVRDYIHVADIANAHVAALKYLRAGKPSRIVNCGYGHGYSVLEVVKAVEQVTGKVLPVEIVSRRLGDPASVVASNQLIQDTLEWRPQYDNLIQIVEDAYRWEKKLLSNK